MAPTICRFPNSSGRHFLTKLPQLMTPLNYIGTLYRIIQESFVNMENMFDLMNQEVKAAQE